MQRVLVINSGSSSLKYRLFEDARAHTPGTGPEDGAAVRVGSAVAEGVMERVGEPGGDAADHGDALRQALGELDLADLAAVGHRVVHGGERFDQPTAIDDGVVTALEELVPLAPLHNPPNVAGIRAARALLPEVPQVAVFDTAFHHTLPPEVATYAIDLETARRHGVRRYGFHGISHAYVARRTAELLARPAADLHLITLHLGNGASACAVAGGRSIATSMGLTPLEGLVMGTRSGDLDPAVVFHLHRVAGLTLDEIDDLLNHRGGLRGLAGVNDMRQLLAARADGDPDAALAFDVYCERIKRYVGGYYATLGRLDAITFTAGVGENSPEIRAAALGGLQRLGIEVAAPPNERSAAVISPARAPVTVCVVPTDEEREIADQVLALVAS